MTGSSRFEVVGPPNWKPRDRNATSVQFQLDDARFQLLLSEPVEGGGTLDVYLDTLTGQELYAGRPRTQPQPSGIWDRIKSFARKRIAQKPS